MASSARPRGVTVTIVARVMRICDGRVSRFAAVFDEAGLLRRLGALPA